MSLSPITQNEKKSSSPLRYHSRNAERFKAIMAESPPREMTNTTKSSPLRSNSTLQSEYKVHETDKYASFEIQNEDRGTWRESPVQSPIRESPVLNKSTHSASPRPVNSHKVDDSNKKTTVQRNNVLSTNRTRINKPTTTATNTLKKKHIDTKHNLNRKDSLETTKSQPTQHSHLPADPNPTHKRSNLPRYMLSTKAFEKKVAKEEKHTLKPRPGGITKRVTTTRLPRYQSTTTINAIEEIKNQMKPGDTYIPMAARIKLYEKGLGNASNKDVSVAPNKYNPNISSQSSSSSRSSSRGPTPTISHRLPHDPSAPPSYARQTSSSTIKQRDPKKKESSFNDRLNLWRNKEEALAQEKKGLKRKVV
ncbi:hypothetical protein A0J61_00402 [Choanephora cucurbitarum]|uniref:Uncharacterized protein n=1 Tax=Choanephora cucurbitarum TaxID=101091 RepID=A0A1C7NR00_9FUNG|nr:hypothetical protein A0J61_00402 [Choanephora cucurbitarum]